MEQVRGKLEQIIRERLDVEGLELHRELSFVQELGLDSLDLVELVMEVEEHFGITVGDEEAEALRTVGDAIELIEKKLSGKKVEGAA